MRTRYLHRPAPLNVARVAATLYRDDDPAEPVADVFDRRAVLHLAAAPRMAEARDADLCEALILGALAEAGELPETVTLGAGVPA